MVDRKEIVKRRIKLVIKLTDLKEDFRIKDFSLPEYSTRTINQYQDYCGLRYYLLLTCFDVLGQKRRFLTFADWVNSERLVHKNERRSIIDASGEGDVEAIVKVLLTKYNQIYGTKTSFESFINSVLTLENKEKLLSSIRVRKLVVYTSDNPEKHIREDKHQLPQEIFERLVCREINYETTEEEKISFLFKIRNNFTHQGISMAHGLHGLAMFNDLDYEIPQLTSLSDFYDGAPKVYEYKWMEIYKKDSDSGLIVLEAQRWPNVLIEILEETLENLKV